MALTDSKIKAAKPLAARYRISDGNGLALEVMPNTGSRLWRYRYKLGGKENLYAMGEFIVAPRGETIEQAEARRDAGRFTLAEARIERHRLRDMVRRGEHPIAVKRAGKLVSAALSANTFVAVAQDFIVKRGGGWSDSHRGRVESFFERDVYPAIGAVPVREITAPTILAILRKVEERGALDMAGLGRGFIGQVFRWGVATGRADSDPTGALRGALQTRKVEHHKPLARTDIAGFFAALVEKGRVNRQTEIAMRVLAYTFVRPGELREATWSEIDLEAGEWRIPAERMKKRAAHVVPLAPQAIELLRELHTITGNGNGMWLFPHYSRPREPMGRTTLGHVIERMGWAGRFNPHGWRATASTLLHEAGFESRLIELQLAHQERNKSRASYDHSARLPERRAMLEWYADTLDATMTPSSNVVPIGRRTG
jgi:integrase